MTAGVAAVEVTMSAAIAGRHARPLRAPMNCHPCSVVTNKRNLGRFQPARGLANLIQPAFARSGHRDRPALLGDSAPPLACCCAQRVCERRAQLRPAFAASSCVTPWLCDRRVKQAFGVAAAVIHSPLRQLSDDREFRIAA